MNTVTPIAAPVREWPPGAGLFAGAPKGWDSVSVERPPVTCPGCGVERYAETIRSW